MLKVDFHSSFLFLFVFHRGAQGNVGPTGDLVSPSLFLIARMNNSLFCFLNRAIKATKDFSKKHDSICNRNLHSGNIYVEVHREL
jgi:hypothetical protein